MAYFLGRRPRLDPHMMVGWTWFNDGVGGVETLPPTGSRSPRRNGCSSSMPAPGTRCRRRTATFLAGLPRASRPTSTFSSTPASAPASRWRTRPKPICCGSASEFHDDPRDHGKLVVHGHTPVKAVTHYGNRVNIDTGAGYGRPISAVVIEGRKVWLLTDAGPGAGETARTPRNRWTWPAFRRTLGAPQPPAGTDRRTSHGCRNHAPTSHGPRWSSAGGNASACPTWASGDRGQDRHRGAHLGAPCRRRRDLRARRRALGSGFTSRTATGCMPPTAPPGWSTCAT